MSTEAPESNNIEPTEPTASSDVAEEQAAPEPEFDRYECRACGYTYEPLKGDGDTVPPGTRFEELSDAWRCVVCGAPKRQFSNVGPVGNPSGFKENLGFGFGVNTLTPGQKNLLIFGSLFLFFLFFLSLYGLK
ncbi:MAG: rubredoxin [Cyanobacteria bacterium P01_A01_bin.135]